MSGHTVTTSWWHRLCTTQVQTERQTAHVKLTAGVGGEEKGGKVRLTLALVTLLSKDAPVMERDTITLGSQAAPGY